MQILCGSICARKFIALLHRRSPLYIIPAMRVCSLVLLFCVAKSSSLSGMSSLSRTKQPMGPNGSWLNGLDGCPTSIGLQSRGLIEPAVSAWDAHMQETISHRSVDHPFSSRRRNRFLFRALFSLSLFHGRNQFSLSPSLSREKTPFTS